MRFPRLRRRPDWVRGAIAGLLGGLAGSWAMNQFQAALRKAQANCSGTSGLQQPEESEDATMKTAAWLLDSLAGVKLGKEQKKIAGPMVHYGFGAAMGAIYGALAEHKRRHRVADGALFGAALFLGADELAVPALGLSQSPAENSLSQHSSALGAHLVYGVTLELTRRETRRALLLI
ncbi:MAG TPA: DUF1440 domain-containing protein [Terriglobales bacterium]|nr:DUF1440 domain-containing protein [Terriglobales bacterium]